MKGLEAMPLRIMASMVLIAIVVGVSFYELNTFLAFQQEKGFKEQLVDVRQAMRTLQSLGDKGSFTSITLTVPGGRKVFIDNTTNTIVGMGAENFTVNMTGKFVSLTFPDGCSAGGCLLEPADYEIRLVYGAISNPKNFSITFE
jgi:hypothetical protein